LENRHASFDGQTEQLTVRLMDRNDNELWRTVLDPDLSS
jgi:alkaline phosphatase D